MGSIRPFESARLVIATLSASGDSEVVERGGQTFSELEERFGPVDLVAGGIPFTWSNYYADELGPSVLRGFLSFPLLVDPSELAGIKRWTNEVEGRWARGGLRRFNLDPGLLTLGSLMLATTKGGAHRVPLAAGIYAELTLLYERGAYRPLPWTYPDWRSPAYGAVLDELRARLKLSLRERRRAI